MNKYFYEINFSYLCTPIDVVYFLLNFKGDEGGVEIWYSLRFVRGFWRHILVCILLTYLCTRLIRNYYVSFLYS